MRPPLVLLPSSDSFEYLHQPLQTVSISRGSAAVQRPARHPAAESGSGCCIPLIFYRMIFYIHGGILR